MSDTIVEQSGLIMNSFFRNVNTIELLEVIRSSTMFT